MESTREHFPVDRIEVTLTHEPPRWWHRPWRVLGRVLRVVFVRVCVHALSTLLGSHAPGGRRLALDYRAQTSFDFQRSCRVPRETLQTRLFLSHGRVHSIAIEQRVRARGLRRACRVGKRLSPRLSTRSRNYIAKERSLVAFVSHIPSFVNRKTHRSRTTALRANSLGHVLEARKDGGEALFPLCT